MLKILLGFSLLLNVVIDCSNNPNFASGRTTIVHLFEWKWKDIAEECELFLGPYGFGGIQISPPNENGIVWEPSWNKNVKRPWYERYQPVSYKIQSRSGTEEELRDMTRRCNAVGVRVYADAVINHMTGNIGEGHGVAGSYFNPGAMWYDAVPYSVENFNHYPKCSTSSGDIESFHDIYQVRNCKLSGLNDLDHGQEYVRTKIANYLNHLIKNGVAGFRIDGGKHMWPGDLENILNRLHNLTSQFFPEGTRPFIFSEVIDLDGTEPIKNTEYTFLGRVTEFKYGMNLGNVIRKRYDQKLKYLQNFGEGWAFLKSNEAVVFMDNHDNQRGHGAGGESVLTYFDSRQYKISVAFMLAWPYGVPKLMSSYSWPRYFVDGKDINEWVGPPHDKNYNTLNVTRNADLTCGNGWICEHRWRQIYNMVRFRNVVDFTPMSHWWDNHNDQIAFARGNKGFIAINNEDHQQMDVWLQTGLPEGRYCDVISGNIDQKSGQCTGRYVDVQTSGYAHIFVDNNWEDPMLAIHAESKTIFPAPAA